MGAQNTNCTMKFIDIPEDRQREAINTVALQTGLPPSSIEKDWWVTQCHMQSILLSKEVQVSANAGT